MDTFYLILIGLLAAGCLLVLVWAKPDLAKKYWGYILLGVAGVSAIVWAVAQRKRAPSEPDQEMKEKEDQLRADLSKVHEEAEVQIAAAIAAESEVHQEVVEIQAIKDERERLNRLSDLFNRTRRRR